jgi:hypothetical protein
MMHDADSGIRCGSRSTRDNQLMNETLQRNTLTQHENKKLKIKIKINKGSDGSVRNDHRPLHNKQARRKRCRQRARAILCCVKAQSPQDTANLAKPKTNENEGKTTKKKK